MAPEINMFSTIVQKTLRVPLAPLGAPGDGSIVARQMDVVLMKNGFKLSGELLAALSIRHPVDVSELGRVLLQTVRELVGSHVKHNAYFKDFPKNVPDTLEFWNECIVDALMDPRSRAVIGPQLFIGMVNLYDLLKYGNYQHSYEDMLAAHESFIPALGDRMTVLHLGKSLAHECKSLYLQLAGSLVPLNEADRELLKQLALMHIVVPVSPVPVRENKAILNAIWLSAGRPILVDTPTDILRLSVALSEGDVTLEKRSKLRSHPRLVRYALMRELDRILTEVPGKLADVSLHREPFKRLGERLHPHEYKEFQKSQQFFAAARRDWKSTELIVRSLAQPLAGKVQRAFKSGRIGEATKLLAAAPGRLFRSLDHLLRSANPMEVDKAILPVVKDVAPKVTGRVLLSVSEHLSNRSRSLDERIFMNRQGTAWVTPDDRQIIDSGLIGTTRYLIHQELAGRLPKIDTLIVEEEALGLALPLSQKMQPRGLGVMPRGSVSTLGNQPVLRFFVHWKEATQRTDYDLSLFTLDKDFNYLNQISWTSLRGTGMVHSGDITNGAGDGSSEFIDVRLDSIPGRTRFIIPQVNVFCGDDFTQAREVFFGYMMRHATQQGAPFEPRTVRTKSEIRGSGKVALPLVFADTSLGWQAKWLHMYLKGQGFGNRVEANRFSSTKLAKTIWERSFIDISGLAEIWRHRTEKLIVLPPGGEVPQDVKGIYIGLSRPENLPKDLKAYTPLNLGELIPQ